MTHANSNFDTSRQDRYALRITARLSEATTTLPHDISERLRAARVQALSARSQAKVVTAAGVQANGGAATLNFDGDATGPWQRVAAWLPLLVLAAGLLAIHVVSRDHQVRDLAEMDSALLTDDLPPAAYTDPGFAQFLKAARD